MALSATEISNVLNEITPALRGGIIQKLFQPTAESVTFEVRRPGVSFMLLISADPDTARLHLIRAHATNPPAPPAFCQLLRAHLQGSRITDVEQLDRDRIVRIDFQTAAGARMLVAELTGRTSNIFLLTAEEKVIGALRTERMKAGQPYAPPLPGTWMKPSAASPSSAETFPLSAQMEREYHQRELLREAHRHKQMRMTELRKAIKKTTRRLESLQNDLAKAARYRDHARYGELLKTHLSEIRKGQETITVVDYFDPALPAIVLPLDPAKDAQHNMEDYFRKHRKHLSAERELQPRIAAAEAEVQRLRSDLQAVERGETNAPEHAASPPNPSQTGTPNRRARASQDKRPFRRFVSADGLPIFVGRNAAENESLTFGVARGHDLWFHVQGTPGSHVVLRLEKGAAAPAESVRDAATLALLYSDLKKSGKGEVIYTKRNAVKRIKSKSPGTVSVTHEKRLVIDLDRDRLRRLKESSGTAPERMNLAQ